ncbi:hemagglutinin repeat-containing protein [Acinetobacter pollinis]|uniref:hemagglutinin repeat-containing protein n=1 Tax=Acinetobacter pollinis TaxID=2605270 RepID=UPI002DBC8BA2|nr:hemagglutinin repeat-containing protein [Acinetobacter pollinis]
MHSTQLANQQGTLQSAQQVMVESTDLNNQQGMINAGTTVDLQSKHLDNSQQGQIQSQGNVTIVSDVLKNSTGRILANKQVQLTGQTIDNQSGQIASIEGKTHLISDEVKNSQGVIHGYEIQVEGQNLDNTRGLIVANQSINIQQQGFLNNQKGTLQADDRIDIAAKGLDNSEGLIQSNDLIRMQVKNGKIYSNQEDFEGLSESELYDLLYGNLGQINNYKGNLVAKNTLDIVSQKLENTGGNIFSKDSYLNIQSINNSGLIQAQNDLNLNSSSITNSGRLFGDNINLNKSIFVNQQGKVIANHKIQAENISLYNVDGIFQADNIYLKVFDFFNNSLGIFNSGNLSLEGNYLSNLGTIQSSGDAVFTMSRIDNKGVINSLGNMDIKANKVENEKDIYTGNNLNIETDSYYVQHEDASLYTGYSDKKGGIYLKSKDFVWLRGNYTSNGDFNIKADDHIQIDDANIFTNNMIMEGFLDKNISEGVLLRKSFINTKNYFSLSSSESSLFNNNSTIISNNIDINVDKYFVQDVDDSILYAKKLLKLNVNDIRETGKIVSERDADLHLGKNYNFNDQTFIKAGHDLNLSVDGEFKNTSKIVSGHLVGIQASAISNENNASIISDNIALKSIGFLNSGLLEASNTIDINAEVISNKRDAMIRSNILHAKSDRLENVGGTILGNVINIESNLLFNQSDITDKKLKSGVIYATQQMNLGVNELYNTSFYYINDYHEIVFDTIFGHFATSRNDLVSANAIDNAWIFSGGDLSIGKSLDENNQVHGRSTYVSNTSARIEAARNLSIIAENINNQNIHLIIDTNETRTPTVKYGLNGKLWDESEVKFGNTNRRGGENGVLLIPNPDPEKAKVEPFIKGGEDWTKYTYDLITRQDEVKASAPAQIIAGQNILFAPETAINNIDSQIIAGGTIWSENSSINNTVSDLRKSVFSRNGESRYHWIESAGTFGNRHRQVWEKPQFYEIDYQQTTTPVTLAQTNLTPSNSVLTYPNKNELDKDALSDSINKFRKTASIDTPNIDTYRANHDADVSVPTSNLNGKGNLSNNAVHTSIFPSMSDKIILTTQDQHFTDPKIVSSQTGISGPHEETNSQKIISKPVQLIYEYVPSVKNTTSIVNSRGPIAFVDGQSLPKDPQVHQEITIKQLPAEQKANVDQLPQLNSIAVYAPESAHATGEEIRLVNLTKTIQVPQSGLYKANIRQNQSYIVETDPTFVSYKNWVSSAYMLDALKLDPTLTQKRLGDGYYEQRLVQDQIAQLTGRRFLNGYHDDDQQYQALMNNGLTFAKEYGLRPGIALTVEQMSHLTSDIVWLVEKPIQLEDGRIVQALVPQVYVRSQKGDLKGDGGLISADHIVILGDQKEINNSGTIYGKEEVLLNAKDINVLKGRIESQQVEMNANNDLRIEDGQIQGQRIGLSAGKDITINRTQPKADRAANIYIPPLNDTSAPTFIPNLSIQAGQNIQLQGVQIENRQGATYLSAGNTVNIDALRTQSINNVDQNKNNFVHQSRIKDVGSEIKSQGDISIVGGAVAGKALHLESIQGSVNIAAQNGVDLSDGLDSEKDSEKHLLGDGRNKSTIQQNHQTEHSIANTISSGKDVSIFSENGNIRATHLIANAGNDVVFHAKQGDLQLLSGIDKTSLESNIAKRRSQMESQQNQTSDIGSEVTSKLSNIQLIGQNIIGKALHLESTQGSIGVAAQANIDLMDGTNTKTSHEYQKTQGAGLFGRRIQDTTDNKKMEQSSIANRMSAGKDISIFSEAGDIRATHLIANAGNDVVFHAKQGDLQLLSGVDQSSSDTQISRTKSQTAVHTNQTTDVGSEITSRGGDIQLVGQNITGQALQLTSTQGSIGIAAQENIDLIDGVNRKTNTEHQQSQKSGFFGKKSQSNDSTQSSEQSIANTLSSGKDISIFSEAGDIRARHLIANATDHIGLNAAQGNVVLLSAVDTESKDVKSAKKGTFKYRNDQVGYIHQDIAQTQLSAGEDINVNAGQNIALQATNLNAKHDLYIANTKTDTNHGELNSDGQSLAPNIHISTIETQNEDWNEHQSGYRGFMKELAKVISIGLKSLPFIKSPVTIGESSKTYHQTISQNSSDLTATNHIGIEGLGNTTLTSTRLNAKDISISGEKVIFDAAQEQFKTLNSHSKETVQGLGFKVNDDSIRLGGVRTDKTTQSTSTTGTHHKVGEITAENLNIQGNTGIDIYGQNIQSTGVTVLDHGQGALNIGGYEDKTTTENKTHTETISAEIGVRNAYLDAAKAVIAVKDAVKALNDARQAYNQAEKDYAAGKITKDALDDTKANIAMATTNVAAAQIAAGAAMAGAVTAASTSYGTGFTIGASGQRQETTDIQSTIQGQWQGSQLDLNHLILRSQQQDANVQGSQIHSTGSTYFDGIKNFNVSAGTEHRIDTHDMRSNSQSASYSSGSVNASIGQQKSHAETQGLNHINSEIQLQDTFGHLNGLNIKGGEVSIGNVDHLKVDGITVESLQDTQSSHERSRGGSVGVGLGGGSKNVSAGFNQGTSQTDVAWVNRTSQLLMGDATHGADLDRMGVHTVTNVGGVIANAGKNADGSLEDYGHLNYSGALTLKDIEDHRFNESRGFNISTTIGIQKDKDANSYKYPNGSTTVGMNHTGQATEQVTKATLGQGTVSQATESTNRDIQHTQETTRDQTTGLLNGQVTVDHRLFTADGRAQIIQEQKDLLRNAGIIGKMTAAGITSLGVATAALASQDATLEKAYNTVMTPANTFKFVQEHPEAAAVIEQFKNGQYQNLMNTQGSLQLLANALNQDVEVLATSITAFYGLKGAYDPQRQQVVLDVNNVNRSSIIETAGHELSHAQGIQSETAADLMGKATGWAYDAGVSSNQNIINQYKSTLGDGQDSTTAAQNQELLHHNNQTFIQNQEDHGDQMENKTSYKQDFINVLTCWDSTCRQKYNATDRIQQDAYERGTRKAVDKFVEDLKNLPNVPSEVYDAIKRDPQGTVKAILSGVVSIPGDILKTLDTIARMNIAGDTPADFEKLGQAQMSSALNVISLILSQGAVTVAKNGVTVVVEAVGKIKNVSVVDNIVIDGHKVEVSTAGFSKEKIDKSKSEPLNADGKRSLSNDYELILDDSKYKYFFGNASADAHNTPRSLQNKQQLASIGIHNTEEGRNIIQNTLANSLKDNTNVIKSFTKEINSNIQFFEIREMLISGPGGFRKMEASFEVMPNNSRRLTTIILKGGL